MAGFLSPMEKVKQLIDELRRQEAKLSGGRPMPMKEQLKTQNEIKRLREELARLERRVL